MKICLRSFGLALLVTVALSTSAGATYSQQVALATDATFQGQVLVAMVISCANAMTEAVTTAGHAQRTTFCTQVLQSPSKWQPVYAYVLASQTNNPMTPLTVPSTVADTLVQTASDAQLGNVAGYFKQ